MDVQKTAQRTAYTDAWQAAMRKRSMPDMPEEESRWLSIYVPSEQQSIPI